MIKIEEKVIKIKAPKQPEYPIRVKLWLRKKRGLTISQWVSFHIAKAIKDVSPQKVKLWLSKR